MEENNEYKATVANFELSVVAQKVVVESNVDKLVAFIEERLHNYSPEKYAGDADAAKKDRTELNKGAEQVKAVRQSIQELNPYADIIARLANAEKLMKSGSEKLGDIVKARENKEKESKRKLVQAEWDSRDFDLFALDKVFNQKWLNKTYKMEDVKTDIDSIISRTYRDLKTIEDFAGVDTETIKAHYLISLDIGETMDYGAELQKKRVLAAKEEKERAEREHNKRISEQKKELAQEQKDYSRRSAVAGLAAAAADIEPVQEEATDYVIKCSLTNIQLLAVKNYLTQQQIEYECRELEF